MTNLRNTIINFIDMKDNYQYGREVWLNLSAKEKDMIIKTANGVVEHDTLSEFVNGNISVKTFLDILISELIKMDKQQH